MTSSCAGAVRSAPSPQRTEDCWPAGGIAPVSLTRGSPESPTRSRRAGRLRCAIRSPFCVHLLSALLASVGLAETIDWNAVGAPVNSFELVDGQLVSTATNTCDGSVVTATFVDVDAVALAPFPGVFSPDTPLSAAYTFIAGPGGLGEGIELTIDFGGVSGNAVENLVFSILDVDRSSWTDQVTITADFAGPIPVTLSCGNGNVPPDCTGFLITGSTATGLSSTAFGSPDGRLDVTIPGPVKSVMVRYDDGSGQSADQVVGFSGLAFDCSSVPISLAFFEARASDGGVDFSWTTVTETATIGYRIYARQDDSWSRLTARSLIPSRSLDSLTPQQYQFHADEAPSTEFILAEVDNRGRERFHGPFELNRPFGTPPAARPIDWDEVRRLRRGPRDRSSVGDARGATPPPHELRIDETRLYQLSYESLLEAGLDLDGVPIESIALTDREGRIPLAVVQGPGRGVFGPGASLEFIGTAMDTLHTDTNVYRLSVDPALARRVGDVHAPFAGSAAETYYATERRSENHLYSFSSPIGDPWYEAAILANGAPASDTFELTIDDSSGGGSETLWVDVWGATDWPDVSPDHHLVIAINDTEVGDYRFDGLRAESLAIPLPPDLVSEGVNTVSLTLPGDTGADFDLVHVEGLALTYERRLVARDDRLEFVGRAAAFTVTGFSSSDLVIFAERGEETYRLREYDVSKAPDGTFQATFAADPNRDVRYWSATREAMSQPSAIGPQRPSVDLMPGRADYLVVSHGDFLDDLGPLLDAHEAQGLRTHVVDVADVYSQYSAGVFDPEAIRTFIGDAATQMGVAYVLLVGGDSYDYKDYLGIGSISFVPTLYASTHPVIYFSPSDALLADIDRDGLSDLAIGRFPVRTTTELETLISKSLAYHSTGSAVLAADQADDLHSFRAISEEIASTLPGWWRQERAYVDDLGIQGARDTLLSELDRGTAVANYVGHSGPTSWTFDGLFTSEDALLLENFRSPAVFTQWGCWNGYHSVPEYDTLSHNLLLAGDHGAAAVIGAATLTEVGADRALALAVMPKLAEPGKRLGDALLEGKLETAEAMPGARDVLIGMTLLGDPALVVEP